MSETQRRAEPMPQALAAACSVDGAVVATLRERIAKGALDLPFPGGGNTSVRFQMLRALGQEDLCLARLAEGHVDALAILGEAHAAAPPGLLGVWAAGPLETLRATHTDEGWRLDGVRRWCSGAPDLDHALVRAESSDGDRLFLVPLRTEGVFPVEGSWPALGMARTMTLDVQFNQVRLAGGAAVGAPGFYLERDGFWFGGAGVAAVWLGGAAAVGSMLADRAGTDPHRLAHLGWVTARLAAVEALLDVAATAIDSQGSDRPLIEQLAHCLRSEAAEAASAIIDRTGRATGAGPLSHDLEHARRVADLTVYVRQSHAETDLEQLGRIALTRRSGNG